MKYLRVEIKREENPGGGTHYVYPSEYDAQKVKFGPSYETFNPKKMASVKARTNKVEYCIIAVDDADAGTFLESDSIVAITEATFVAEGDDNTGETSDIIEDEEAVLKVLDKVVKGLPITPADLNVIDGAKPGRGVRRGKKFNEHWQNRKTELGL